MNYLPHSRLGLVYDSVRSVAKGEVCTCKCIRRGIQAVFVMFISSTSALRQILMTSQHSFTLQPSSSIPLLGHLDCGARCCRFRVKKDFALRRLL